MNSIENSCKSNPKAFFSYINSNSYPNSLPTEMYLKNKQSHNIEDSIDLFAEFFHSTFTTTNIPPVIFNPPTHLNLHLAFSDEQMIKIVSAFEEYGGLGPDGIPNIFIKKSIHSLIYPLRIIFQKSFSTCTFPTLWKSSYIIPIHKRGDRKDVTNYRPISLLSGLSKILESIFYDRLYSESSALLCHNQHGFVKGLSTTTNLAVYTNFVSSALDQKKQIDTIYTDFTKAFDKVSHGILVDKLANLGISECLILWIYSYLGKRTQSIRHSNCLSSPQEVLSGVPQGSKLGPLLFILYINDLAQCIKHALLLLYADDCKLVMQINSPFDSFKLQTDLTALEEWSLKNLIPLSTPKCAVMHTYRCHSPFFFQYKLNNQPLNTVNSFKDLGVIFDNKLKFKEHIDSVTARCMKNMGWIRRHSTSFNNISTIRCLFNSFVLPHLFYASQIWAPFRNVHAKKLELVNHQLIRYISFKDGNPIHFFDHDYSQPSAQYNVHTISSQHKLLDSITGFKILKDLIILPELNIKFHFRPLNQLVRNFRPLAELKASSDTFHNSFVPRTIRILNDISQTININPEMIKNTSVQQFKAMASPLLLEFYNSNNN